MTRTPPRIESTFIFIDVDNWVSRFFHALPPRHAGPMRVEAAAAFAVAVFKFRLTHNADRVVFCFDGGCGRRRRIYPAYKANRTERGEDDPRHRSNILSQLELLHSTVLPMLGCKNILRTKDYEAEDLIAAQCGRQDFTFGIIVSSDADLYQCLKANVGQWNFRQLMNIQQFVDKFGVRPDRWKYVKAIAGCKSDNVSGCPGVGEKTATKYQLRRQKGCPIYYPWERRIQEWKKDNYELNLSLVELPFRGTPTHATVDEGPWLGLPEVSRLLEIRR